MSMFTLAISCFCNLPWFVDLTFQVPMQSCSLQHWTLLSSPVTSTTGCSFCFGSVSSFFLELFLHWSSVAYWALTNLGSSSFSVLSFCLFILFMGFWSQEYWRGLPFPSPLDHFVRTLQHHPSVLGGPTWYKVALIGIHITLPFEPPSRLPAHATPLDWYRAPVWVSWAVQQIPVCCLVYIWWCKFPWYSFHTSHPSLPSPHVRMSILYVCFSISAL